MRILDFIFKLFGISDTANSVAKTDFSVANRQLADYFEKALQDIPDYYNLLKSTASGIFVVFLDSTHAKVTVQKRKIGENGNPKNISLRWIPCLNDIFLNIRMDAEYQLEIVRQDTVAKLVELQNSCVYNENANAWNIKSAEIANAYTRYVYKIEHLLCGVKIIDYVEDDGTFTFNVVIDNTLRVPIALA